MNYIEIDTVSLHDFADILMISLHDFADILMNGVARYDMVCNNSHVSGLGQRRFCIERPNHEITVMLIYL